MTDRHDGTMVVDEGGTAHGADRVERVGQAVAGTGGSAGEEGAQEGRGEGGGDEGAATTATEDAEAIAPRDVEIAAGVRMGAGDEDRGNGGEGDEGEGEGGGEEQVRPRGAGDGLDVVGREGRRGGERDRGGHEEGEVAGEGRGLREGESPVAQWIRVPHFGCVGCGFESRRASREEHEGRLRLVVRTLPFRGGNRGSIPLGDVWRKKGGDGEDG